MDANPGETPNPLNPGPESAGPIEEPKSPTDEAIAKVSTSEPAPEPVSAPEPAPMPEPTPAPTPAPTPLDRPMEKAPTSEVKPVKRKKTGFIIGAIICLFLAIGCGVAAALLLLNPKSDPVSAALSKLFSDDAPANLTVNGDINIDISEQSIPFSNINVALDVNTMTKAPVNSAKATVSATLRGGNEQISAEANEIYPSNGDFYIMFDGVPEALNQFNTRQQIVEESDETTDEIIQTENTNNALGMFSEIFNKIDGQWLRVSSEEIGEYRKSLIQNSNISCVADIINDTSKNTNSIAKLYQDNPFIISTTENVKLVSKNHPVYLIKFDEQKLEQFIDALNNSNVTRDLLSCLNSSNAQINSKNLIESIKKLPDIYVEIDNENRFTRLYFTIENNSFSIIVDLEFTYPVNINVSEPVEYQDLNTIMQELFNANYQNTTITE